MSKTLMARAGSLAAGAGGVTVQSLSTYLPVIPSISSETAQKIVLTAPSFGDCGEQIKREEAVNQIIVPITKRDAKEDQNPHSATKRADTDCKD